MGYTQFNSPMGQKITPSIEKEKWMKLREQMKIEKVEKR